MDDAQLLRLHLSQRDSPCPGCGYNLRSLPSDRCPECNEVIVLRTSLAEPRLAQYLAALLPAAIVGGTMLLMIAVVVGVSTVINKWPNFKEQIVVVWFPAAAGVVLTLGAALLLAPRGRRWFRRQSSGRRSMLVATSITTALLVIVVWSYLFVSKTF